MPETIDDDAIPEYAPLTRKQAAFTDAVIASGFEHGSIIAAYRSAYDSHGGQDNTHSVEAWKLLRHPKIAQRLRDAADAQGATTDRLISGILRRTERTEHDQTAINGYELLARIRGLLGTPTTTAAAPAINQNIVQLGGSAISEIIGMLTTPSALDGNDDGDGAT
jgi:hypothetical protein